MQQIPNALERHALVIGAGMSGLLGARVLAGCFERVTVLDRDRLADGPVSRKGVPQGRHLHSLAVRGSELLEEFFPGLDAELSEAGCPAVDQAGDTVTDVPSGRLPRFTSGIVMRAASRDLLEWRIRKRLLENPRIQFISNREATELLLDKPTNRVTGLSTRIRGGEGTEEFAADLILDASGQSSRMPRWLAELGLETPEETVVDAGLGYATRWYRVPENFAGDWKSLAVLPKWPEEPRGGSLRRVEGDRWTAVLVGIGADNQPPNDPEAFQEFARSLPSPTIADALEDAEPISPAYGYRRTANRRRHYDSLDTMPENLLVIGDAACVMNPTYGQGMTLAALSATALETSLSKNRSLKGLARDFHRRQTKAIASSWTTTASSDSQWSANNLEELGLFQTLLHIASGEVFQMAVAKKSVTRTLLEVKNLVKPPGAMLRPGILFPAIGRVLKKLWHPELSKSKPHVTGG
ncbi:MAG: FAD-dependent monooxygenase [Actinomycetota bacterium]|nr:FAD-dependent monooxygenase [Actinomycetota bacterium]